MLACPVNPAAHRDFRELETCGKKILKAYACGEGADGRRIDTCAAEMTMQVWDKKYGMNFRFTGREVMSGIFGYELDFTKLTEEEKTGKYLAAAQAAGITEEGE